MECLIAVNFAPDSTPPSNTKDSPLLEHPQASISTGSSSQPFSILSAGVWSSRPTPSKKWNYRFAAGSCCVTLYWVFQFPIAVDRILIDCPDGSNRVSQAPQSIIVRGSSVPPPYSSSTCFHPLTDRLYCTCRSHDAVNVSPMDILECSHHPMSLRVIGKYTAIPSDTSSSSSSSSQGKVSKISIPLASAHSFPIQYVTVTIVRQHPLSQSSSMLQIERIAVIERSPRSSKQVSSPEILLPKRDAMNVTQSAIVGMPTLPSIFPTRPLEMSKNVSPLFGAFSPSESHPGKDKKCDGEEEGLGDSDPLHCAIKMALRCLQICIEKRRQESEAEELPVTPHPHDISKFLSPLKHWVTLLLTLLTVPSYYTQASQILWRICCDDSPASDIVYSLSLHPRFVESCCPLLASLSGLPLLPSHKSPHTNRDEGDVSLCKGSERLQRLFDRLRTQMTHFLSDRAASMFVESETDNHDPTKKVEEKKCDVCHAVLGIGCLGLAVKMAKYLSIAIDSHEDLSPSPFHPVEPNFITLRSSDIPILIKISSCLFEVSRRNQSGLEDGTFFRILSQFVRLGLVSYSSLFPDMASISDDSSLLDWYRLTGCLDDQVSYVII